MAVIATHLRPWVVIHVKTWRVGAFPSKAPAEAVARQKGDGFIKRHYVRTRNLHSGTRNTDED